MARTVAVAVLAVLGLSLLPVRRGATLGSSIVMLACAAAVALHHGAEPAAAPLWGAGLLTAGDLATRALMLPTAGTIEAAAVSSWLAGLAVLAGIGLAASSLALLAAGAAIGNSFAGLGAGALLAVGPTMLVRPVGRPSAENDITEAGRASGRP